MKDIEISRNIVNKYFSNLNKMNKIKKHIVQIALLVGLITPLFEGTSNQYFLNTSETIKTIDVSTFQSGQYAVVLICDGNIVDFRNIFIQ